ncbi:MAG: RecX family transcriptional regulator [Candidatus Roizmanbacteria bacterium]|nr:MAG: RecX family transcriptional regulator [Candidatus Roizmanbacteria bacterium]
MNRQDHVQKALNRAYFYLKFRPRTRKEVVSYLSKKSEKFYHWSPEVIEEALSLLEEEGLINDKKFVESFVVTRNIVKPKSEFALKQELLKAGVEKDIIDEFFTENPSNQEDLAKQALHNRWFHFNHFDKKTRFEKAAQFLMRRGFSFSIAKKVIEEMEEG